MSKRYEKSAYVNSTIFGQTCEVLLTGDRSIYSNAVNYDWLVVVSTLVIDKYFPMYYLNVYETLYTLIGNPTAVDRILGGELSKVPNYDGIIEELQKSPIYKQYQHDLKCKKLLLQFPELDVPVTENVCKRPHYKGPMQCSRVIKMFREAMKKVAVYNKSSDTYTLQMPLDECTFTSKPDSIPTAPRICITATGWNYGYNELHRLSSIVAVHKSYFENKFKCDIPDPVLFADLNRTAVYDYGKTATPRQVIGILTYDDSDKSCADFRNAPTPITNYTLKHENGPPHGLIALYDEDWDVNLILNKYTYADMIVFIQYKYPRLFDNIIDVKITTNPQIGLTFSLFGIIVALLLLIILYVFNYMRF